MYLIPNVLIENCLHNIMAVIGHTYSNAMFFSNEQADSVSFGCSFPSLPLFPPLPVLISKILAKARHFSENAFFCVCTASPWRLQGWFLSEAA